MKTLLLGFLILVSLSSIASDIIYVRHDTDTYENKTFTISGSKQSDLVKIARQCKHRFGEYYTWADFPRSCEAMMIKKVEELGYKESSCGKFTKN